MTRNLLYVFLGLAVTLTAVGCSNGAQKEPAKALVDTKSTGTSVGDTPPVESPLAEAPPSGDSASGPSPALIMNVVNGVLF